MVGKPGKILLTAWHDDAQQPIEQLWDEIEARFGICPSFFKLAQYEPPIARNLFRQAEFAYLDNPMPAHFKERLFTWLSRFCEARYCVARHCAFLLGRGRVAGDAGATPLSAEQALSLLKELMPDKEELPEYLRALEETPAPLGDWPDFDSDLGRRFRVACAMVFLDPGRAAPWLRELLRLLGPRRYEQLMLFLAFVGAEHFWTQVHPELAFEPDLEAILREHEALAETLLHSADEAACWELGQRLHDELQSLRESQKNLEALRDSEARFKAIFENAAVGIARVAPDGRWLEVSQRLCDIVGYAREELMTKTFSAITHPEDLDADWEQRRRLLAGEIDNYSMAKRYQRKDGSIVWSNLTVSLVCKENGSPDYFIFLVEDITERKQAEDALRESEQRFARFMRHLPGLAWIKDLQGRYVYANAAAVKAFRTAPGELYGRTDDEIFPPEVAAQFKENDQQALTNEEGIFVVETLEHEDGILHYSAVRKFPIPGQDGRETNIGGIAIDITESKRADEALRESELRFRTMISAVPSLTFEADTAGNNIFVSKQWLAYTGMTAEETAGAGYIRAYHPDEAEDVLAQWSAAVRSGMSFESKCRIRAADGSYRWFLNRALPGSDAEGHIVRWAGSLTDIDDMIRIEEALRESESRFRQLTESLPQLVWTCRADGACDYISPQFVAYTGIPEAEQLGFGWLRQIHPDEREPLIAAWNRTVATGEPFDVEYRIRRNDGMYRWFKTRAVALRDSSDKVIKWFGTNTDIDDHKQADRALRESKERLASIVSSAMDAIITVDEDQHIVLFNEAAERMFGCPAAEAIGQPLNRFIPERFRRTHTEHVRRYGETGGTSRAMGRLRALAALRADGTEFPIEAAISSVEVGGRKLYTVIHRDITERKRAEAEREQLAREQVARAAAEAANRSKDEFLAMVSHELRSPLNAILGYTRMLRSGPLDRDAINNATAAVERSAKAQLQIIEDLLDSARIVAGKLRIELGPVDLVPALEAALDTVRSAAEAKGVTLIADFGLAPVETLGDSTRLQQIVWNLLSNAVKFTPEGGRVELRMESDVDSVRITVSDTGKGIEPEFLPFVFDRFRQADPSSARHYGGLGLGLSLVKHLVELHGGRITAASEGAGQGSTFTVTLPRRHLEFIAPTPAVTPREVRTEGAIMIDRDVSLEGVSVLVVDDQDDARELLVQALGGYGAQVTAVSSGAEALAFLSNPPGGKRPDALIMDIAMPEEDGYTVLKKVRALEAAQDAAGQIPAIALTAYGRSEDRLRALQAGFNMHVVKPVDPAELAVVIASATTSSAWERKRKK
jgi:PAS domain S-box-containing protein